MKMSLLQLKKLILRVWFVSVGKLSKSGPATHRLIHLPWGAPGNPRPLLPSTVTLPFAFPPTIFKAGEQNGAEFLSPKLPAHEERPWGVTWKDVPPKEAAHQEQEVPASLLALGTTSR